MGAARLRVVLGVAVATLLIEPSAFAAARSGGDATVTGFASSGGRRPAMVAPSAPRRVACASDGSSSVRLLRDGAAAPGLPGLVFAPDARGLRPAVRVAADDGDVQLVHAWLAGDSVSEGNDESLWWTDGHAVALVAREGDAVSFGHFGAASHGNVFGDSGATFAGVADEGGAFAFVATVRRSDGRLVETVWRGADGVIEPVAAVGRRAPGTALAWKNVHRLGLAAGGALVVEADAGTSESTRRGIWWDRGSGLEPLVVEGDAVPGRGTVVRDLWLEGVGSDDVRFRARLASGTRSRVYVGRAAIDSGLVLLAIPWRVA